MVTNIYEWAAELTIFIHFLFIVFVVLGSLLCLLNLKLIIFHLLSVAWGLYIELSSKICPLTYLENWLLEKAGLNSYSNGFIANYIFRIVYPDGLTDQIQIYLATSLIIVNIFLYSLIYYLKRN